jgi:hypothetical protein
LAKAVAVKVVLMLRHLPSVTQRASGPQPSLPAKQPPAICHYGERKRPGSDIHH